MGSRRDEAHGRWYRHVAEHYGMLYDRERDARAARFLEDLLRRHGPVRDVLDVACGPFGIDAGLVRAGYRVVGRDLSPDMIAVARKALDAEGLEADLATGDMRTLDLGERFDAVLCLGTAFNYLAEAADVRRALETFRRHLRSAGLLVLDLTNFAQFIDDPMNVRAEVDYRAPDGTRIGIFGFNEQNPEKTIHIARFLTLVQRGRDIDILFDEAPLKIWTQEGLAEALAGHGFDPVEWWGDLAPEAPYEAGESPRLVVVARAP